MWSGRRLLSVLISLALGLGWIRVARWIRARIAGTKTVVREERWDEVVLEYGRRGIRPGYPDEYHQQVTEVTRPTPSDAASGNVRDWRASTPLPRFQSHRRSHFPGVLPSGRTEE